MQGICFNSVRFLKLHLCNYGIFKGSHDFVFDPQRTVIIGGGGTGKTTIVNILKYLGPAPGVTLHCHSKSTKMSVEVVTGGNCDLIQRFSSIIFLGCRSAQLLTLDQKDTLVDILDDQQEAMVRVEERNIFDALILERPREAEENKGLSPETMSDGEKVCLNYAFAFAVRRVLNLDLPTVFDSPYGALDLRLSKGVRAFLKHHSGQQILLGTGSEFQEEDEANYKLNHVR